ncbi:MAG TPA: cell division protein FtsH, partial [Anaerolineae bacterium]|nr:cell division protein FtsH [Anaerolineae bacterium]
MNSSNAAKWFIYLLIALAIMAIMWSYNATSIPTEEISISQLAQDIKDNKVTEIAVASDGREITITYTNEDEATSHISDNSSLEEQLAAYGVTLGSSENQPNITYTAPSQWENWFSIAILLLPALLIIGFFYFMFRQSQGGNNQAMSFGKSKARMFTGDQPTVNFDDVAGCDEAKEELKEVVEFL